MRYLYCNIDYLYLNACLTFFFPTIICNASNDADVNIFSQIFKNLKYVATKMQTRLEWLSLNIVVYYIYSITVTVCWCSQEVAHLHDYSIRLGLSSVSSTNLEEFVQKCVFSQLLTLHFITLCCQTSWLAIVRIPTIFTIVFITQKRLSCHWKYLDLHKAFTHCSYRVIRTHAVTADFLIRDKSHSYRTVNKQYFVINFVYTT